MVQPLWKIVWRYLRKLNIELSYDPAIPLLGIYPDKTFIEKETDTISNSLKRVGAAGASPPDKDTGEGRSSDDWGQQLVMGQKQLWKLDLPSLILIPGSLQMTMKCHLP